MHVLISKTRVNYALIYLVMKNLQTEKNGLIFKNKKSADFQNTDSLFKSKDLKVCNSDSTNLQPTANRHSKQLW